MSRLPVRLRLTLPFAAAMSVGLAAMGLFIYVRVGGTMLSSVDQNLAAQVQEATHNIAEERSSLIDEDVSSGATIAQLVRADGSVVESSLYWLLVVALSESTTVGMMSARPPASM